MKKVSPKKIRIGLIIGVGVIILLSLSVYFVLPRVSFYIEAQKTSRQLESKLSPFLKGFTGDFSLVFKDLNNPFLEFANNKDKEFPAASLIKVPIVTAALFAVKEGKLRLDEEFILEIKDVTSGSGILKNGGFPRRITLRELLELMISRSDNTATNKVIGILGFGYINDAFKKFNLQYTILNRKIMDFKARKKGIENYTSCRDLVYIFEKIYKREMIDASSSDLMISFLKKQEINDRIPKYLPKDIAVAHKTGLAKNVVGDVGIVFSGCSDYIICVITTGFSNYRAAKDFIAKSSLVVYNTFRKDRD